MGVLEDPTRIIVIITLNNSHQYRMEGRGPAKILFLFHLQDLTLQQLRTKQANKIMSIAAPIKASTLNPKP